MTLENYDNQQFTPVQEEAINTLNTAIEYHFQVMGVDPAFTENVWEKIDQLVREQLL